MVNVFCQLVSYIRDTEAWDEYITRSTPVNHALAPVHDSWPLSSVKAFREFERSWTRDEGLNRDLLRIYGPSMCADLVKVSILSFHTYP